MSEGYYIAEGRKWPGFAVYHGVTCEESIANMAKSMGWLSWSFHCPALGIVISR